jgi:molybdenum cofactor cytidylyltransferase
MTEIARAGALVLASGLSRRFGPSDKLLALLDGRPLASHIAATLGAMPLKSRVAVCAAGNSAVRALFEAEGFAVIDNPDPARGQASSLVLGLAALAETQPAAMLVCLGDMPFVSAAHLAALVDRLSPATPVAGSRSGDGTMSPPVAMLHGEHRRFLSLTGDSGGRVLLKDALAVDAPNGMMDDFDTPERFAAAR